MNYSLSANSSRLIPLFFAAVLLIASSPLSSQEADNPAEPSIVSDELQSVEPIEFTSYVGPHAQVDSLASIIDIGTRLATGFDDNGLSDYAGKYSIQHIISENPGPLFDADILNLSAAAGVDHIRNLRHIISGYLQARYSYQTEAADTISTFITYYNAFYRQNADYFAQRYSPAVNAALTPENIGLSTNYVDWPGSTQIIIPLSAIDVLNQEPSLDLDETGKKAVSEYLNDSEQDAGNAEGLRQDMVELRQDKLADDQGELDRKQEELQQDNRDVQKTLEVAQAKEAETENLAEREAAKKEQNQLEQQLEENQKEQNVLDGAQQTIAQRQEVLNKDQRELNQENTLAAQVQDQPVDDSLPATAQIVLLPVKNEFFQFFGIDNDSLKIVKRSELNSIRSPNFVSNESGYVVVAGEYNITDIPVDSGNTRRIRLVKLKPNLDTLAQGNDEIHADSGVWEYNGDLFAYLADGTLGRFNADLELQTQSTEELQIQQIVPQFLGSYVLVQNSKRIYMLLDLVTLSKRQELKIIR